MKNSPYGITNENMTKGEVVAVGSYDDDDDIIVKVLEHKIAPSAEGSYHPVNSKYFELYDYNKIVITTDGNKTLRGCMKITRSSAQPRQNAALKTRLSLRQAQNWRLNG